MTDAALFELAAAYIALHFLLYVLFLRQRPTFRRERSIFLYHFISACLFSPTALILALAYADAAGLATGLGLVSLHGIYSLSFLELWSLAQGGYSIGIMAAARNRGTISNVTLLREFSPVGDDKKAGRLTALLRLGLIKRQGGGWVATGRGRVVATNLRSLLWLADPRHEG